MARDSFTRDSIKNLTRKLFRKTTKLDPEKEKEIEKTRLDILKNVEPFVTEEDEHAIEDMYNRKIQYISGNILLGTFLLNKYKMDWFAIILMLWLITTFPF